MVLFETPRLIIRHYTPEDADHFFKLNGDKEVVKYIRPAIDRAASDAFLEKNIAYYATHPNLGRFAVIDKYTGAFVGSFALIPISDDAPELQLGYAFLPSAWGKGYATEVTRAGIPFFFKHQQDDILYAITEAEHTGSQKVLEKCGFTRIGEFMEDDKLIYKFSITRKQAMQHPM